tara:strand:- start:258 stop:947 length:690 start_codon:yes stop_codon:yes gene_type:complete
MRISRRQLRRIIREALSAKWTAGPEAIAAASEMRAALEKDSKLRSLAGQELGLAPQPFEVLKTWRMTSPQDMQTRDYALLKHPDGSTKAYFLSSGTSNVGDTGGTWRPFEGFSTWERVPPEQTYTDLNSKGRPYGESYLMAKTYWNQPGGKTSAPPGSIHHQADIWLRRAIRSGGRFIPEKTMTVTDPVKQLPAINKFLDNHGAIDHGATALRRTSAGRRLLHGIDIKS